LSYLPPKFTSLWIDLKGENPDDASSDVPYEKGYSFLKMLENKYGRQKFDEFLKGYFKTFSFQTMNTTKFIDYMKKNLTDGDESFVQNWIYETGMPNDYSKSTSARFEKVEEKFNQDLKLVQENKSNQISKNENWSTLEWVHYLRTINPEEINRSTLEKLDDAYHFTDSQNAEIAAAWFEKAILADYEKAYPNLEKFLIKVGRRKYLEPLYRAMENSGKKELAVKIYEKARPGYHSVSYRTIDEILNYKP